MKTEPILQEVEAVKERLAARADGDTQRFLDQMETWLVNHPHAGPVVNSPEELRARIQAREATEPPPPPCQPYKVHDPVIAEIHRIREQLARERETSSSSLTLRDEPPPQKD
jgi:hypothetical protein